MMSSAADFIKANIGYFGYSSKQDLIENLYLSSLIDSYTRIAHTITTENEIRDRFMADLYQTPSKLKDWLDQRLMYLDWENWKFTPELKLARADISFKISGCEFIIECKRLKYADNLYFEEGLSRFIKHHYAKGDEFAGMIGFVINDRDDDILKGLKAKVKNHDHLSTPFSTGTFAGLPASFQSSHTRTDSTTIHVYHLLFSFAAMAETQAEQAE
ncbi:hypothetical protein [Mucilaginibacter gossypii]|uniref:Uncharacterized protein n=1 Tax=Mucilaginibacter gossypii TaxID=551996 RepID=A0A1G8B7F8_9SPHI|nr:hypothetical protein [Mucilaginibacter gossypii]SDH28933.1 hypothetical protein SAMN05192573_108110 [Mucilaginibacter gossypii]